LAAQLVKNGCTIPLFREPVLQASLRDASWQGIARAYGDVISDHNQQLACGEVLASATVAAPLQEDNFDLLKRAKPSAH
jgi:hypothetical protein